MEPQLQCVEAVLSPQTGIVDSHQFMLALQGDAERDGANIAFHTPVTDIDARDALFHRRNRRRHADASARTDCVINSAGLHANDIARNIRAILVKACSPVSAPTGHGGMARVVVEPGRGRLLLPPGTHGRPVARPPRRSLRHR